MKCFVLNQEIIRGDEHHVVMQAKGGKEGKTVFLRPDIHDLVHNGSAKEVDLLFSSFSKEQKERFLFLRKSLNVTSNSKITKKITIEVSEAAHKRLTIESESRRVGIAKFLSLEIEKIFGDKL